MTEKQKAVLASGEGSGWAIFKRLLSYVSVYKLALIVGIIAMVGYAGVDTLLIWSLQPLLDNGFSGQDPDILKLMPIFVVVVIAFRGLFAFISSYCMAWVGNNIVMTLQRQVFAQMIALPVSFFDKTNTGELISKITYDASQVSSAASSAVVRIFREGALLIGLVTMMFFQSWQLSLVFFLVAPFVGIAIGIVSKRFRKIGKNLQNAMGLVTTSSEQMLKGHKEVLMFGGQSIENEKFKSVSNTVRSQNMKMAAANAISVPIIQTIASFALAIVLFLATFPEIMDSLSPGKFVVIVSAMMGLMKPIKSVTQVNNEIQRGLAAAQSLFSLLDTTAAKDTGTKVIERAKGDISLNEVEFTYPTAENKALNKVSFELKSGQTFALVGRSGSGKSTIANLLTRFYDIQGGSILIDGENIEKYTLSSLRSQVAVVSQKVHLFNVSIADNIAYATENKYTREDIIKAAETANAMEFIKEFPDGIDTIVGEDGALLSGGQRQRIAIARALLRDAPILILDEATSALDTESERHIQSALDVLQKNRTSIVIAHRLSTIENADQILVVDNGKIAERGTHAELIKKKGIYYNLSQMQSAGAA
jgi:subfamily B ATP-binding cassette protein MsbA